MAQIEITKQPLYGSVYWDGYDFIYTPREGYTGNDVFYYTKNENGIITSYTKYVNPTNVAPVVTNLALSADAYQKTTISIMELMVDDTNPFNELKIVSIENPVHGKIENTGTSLVYYPNYVNTVEHLQYVVSDKQYSSTGTLTLSVINASKQLYTENDTFKYRLPKNYNIGVTLTGLSSNWESATDVLTTYKDTWNAFDPTNAITCSNYIEAASGNLNKLYNNISAYDAMYSLVSTNSSTWINDRNIIDYIKNNKQKLINTYNIVSIKNIIWDNDYTKISGLSTEFIDNTIKFDALTATVNDNIKKWNSNEIYNVLEPNYYKWNTSYNALCASDKNKEWNNAISAANILLSEDSVSASNNFINVYNTVTVNSGLWENTNIYNLLTSSSSNLINTFNTISSLSDGWNNTYNDVTNISSYYNDKVRDLNSYHNTVIDKSPKWNKIVTLYGTVALSTTNWNKVFNNKSNYDNLYSILCANSGKWYSNVSLLTGISSFIFTESLNWDTSYNSIKNNHWVDNGNFYKVLTAKNIEHTENLTSVYNTITATSSIWTTSTFYNNTTAGIAKWNSSYDTLVTKNNYISWNNDITNFDTLSTNFYSTGSALNIIDDFIQSKLSIWNNKPVSTTLSGSSAKWNTLYTSVCTSSGKWSFDEKDEYKSAYSYVTSQSANLIDLSNFVTVYSGDWNNHVIGFTTLSSQFLTGSETVNLTAKDLYVMGDTHIKGNLSALGGRFLIDTTLNTTSGFNINNSDDNDAVVVNKIGGGAIFNLNTVDSTVLYVKANPKTVGINLSAISDVSDEISNILLTVSGNISATGYVYPFPEKTTLYASKSAAYESAYTYLTANSGAIDAFILNNKPLYDSMVTYINNGAISSFSAVTIPYYDNYANQVTKWFNKNTQTNNFIALCGNVFDVDTKFAANSSKYEQAYNFTSTAILTSKKSICYFFGNSIIPSSQKINITLQDDIKIESWELYANESTLSYNLSVDLLNCSYTDFGRIGHPVSITNNNPPNLTIYNKNSASDLDALWDKTLLSKGSILQFELINTNNSPVSGLLINLTVVKQ